MPESGTLALLVASATLMAMFRKKREAPAAIGQGLAADFPKKPPFPTLPIKGPVDDTRYLTVAESFKVFVFGCFAWSPGASRVTPCVRSSINRYISTRFDQTNHFQDSLRAHHEFSPDCLRTARCHLLSDTRSAR